MELSPTALHGVPMASRSMGQMTTSRFQTQPNQCPYQLSPCSRYSTPINRPPSLSSGHLTDQLLKSALQSGLVALRYLVRIQRDCSVIARLMGPTPTSRTEALQAAIPGSIKRRFLLRMPPRCCATPTRHRERCEVSAQVIGTTNPSGRSAAVATGRHISLVRRQWRSSRPPS